MYVYNLESLARFLKAFLSSLVVQDLARFTFNTFLSGGRHSALLFSSRELKKDEPSVHFFHLTPSSLLLVAGTR